MLIGRTEERTILRNLLDSDQSEFVAVYGRRRVGKTFLIKETFSKGFTFQHAGIYGGDRTLQLTEFRRSLELQGATIKHALKDWFEAFAALGTFLEQKPAGKKIVFIDEMPWMDTAKSNFISALEHFWNGWVSMRTDIILIVCGSSTSWIIKKLINNYGGLHNRLTRQIVLQPFTLSECEKYVKARRLKLTRRQILETYMVLGGIPFYWSYLQKGASWAQNINQLFFTPSAPLRNEFDALYASLFRNPEGHIKVVTALGKKKVGMTRNEIVAALGENHGGTLTTILEELEQCGFIRSYISIGKTVKDTIYQLIDNFTLFHFKFIANHRTFNENFFLHLISKPTYFAWSGLAFERVCLQHIKQIKHSMGIGGVESNVYSWIYKAANEQETGVQIDLLLDRADDTINLCEMKFGKDKFTIDSKYDAVLRHKLSVFQDKTRTRKSVSLVMITSYGITPNAYAGDIGQQLVMDDLFD